MRHPRLHMGAVVVALAYMLFACFCAPGHAQTTYTPDSHSRGGNSVTRSGQTVNGAFAQFTCPGPGPCSTVGPGVLPITTVGSLVLIQSKILSAAAASVTFSNIPSGYQDLVLVVNGRVSDSAAAEHLDLQFNGDAGSNYLWQQVNGNGSTAGANGNGSSAVTSLVPCNIPGATAPSNDSGSCEISVPSYAATTFNKQVYSVAGYRSATGSAGSTAWVGTGSWESTAAVTSLTATDDGGGNWNAGSTFAIYGRGGNNVTVNPQPGLPLICEVVTSGSQASVTVGGGTGSCPTLPQSYRDVLVVVSGRATTSASNDNVEVQFNGDTGANYNAQVVQGANTTASAAQNNGQTSGYFGAISAATATANFSGYSAITVSNYAGTTFQKSWAGVDQAPLTTGASGLQTQTVGGRWNSTAAITALKVFIASGNFVDGSVVDVYGIGGGPAANLPLIPPQGRLTLTSGVPVMTSDVTGATTIYYAPYQGAMLPVGGIEYTAGQLSFALNTTAHTSGNLYDIGAYNNAGTIALCTSPAWTNSTTRSAAISQTNGIWYNTASLTCGLSGSSSTTTIAPGQWSYLGTFETSANGQTGVSLRPAAASGGAGAFIYLWNAYNRRPATAISRDNKNTWTPSNGSFAARDASTTNRVTVVDGLAQTTIDGSLGETVAGTNDVYQGIDLDSTTAVPDCVGQGGSVGNGENPGGACSWYPQLGLHYYQAVEGCTGACTASGAGGLSSAPIAWLLVGGDF